MRPKPMRRLRKEPMEPMEPLADLSGCPSSEALTWAGSRALRAPCAPRFPRAPGSRASGVHRIAYSNGFETSSPLDGMAKILQTRQNPMHVSNRSVHRNHRARAQKPRT